MSKIVIGTRSTRLAQIQAQEVADAIRAAFPDREVEVKEYSTSGDEDQGPIGEIGVAGVWVKQLEDALLAKEIDMAVHSAKDLPTKLPEGLVIGALTKRRKVNDALIAKGGEAKIEDLPAGAKIGTASARRRIEILEKRKDVEIVPLRGSVETRLAKLDAGEVDAIVLAVAGLQRLGLQDRITGTLDEDFFIPQAGQGALAVEVRAGELLDVCAKLEHANTRIELDCERAFLEACDAGCEAPIGVRALVVDNEVMVKGVVAEHNGVVHFRSGRSGPKTMAKLNGKMLAQMMLAMGGKQVLDKWRAERAARAQAQG